MSYKIYKRTDSGELVFIKEESDHNVALAWFQCQPTKVVLLSNMGEKLPTDAEIPET
jgi:hypothetical protein